MPDKTKQWSFHLKREDDDKSGRHGGDDNFSGEADEDGDVHGYPIVEFDAGFE